MAEINWLSYIIIIIFTALFTSILTEHAVIKRIKYSEGVDYIAGKCRLKNGYGPINDKTKE